MREIKFRAWDLDNKVMQWPCEIPINEFQGDEITRVFENGIVTCPPNPDTLEDYILMQFTGLKDKNGKEIYEGDIVRSTREKASLKNMRAEVTWLEGNPGFYLRDNQKDGEFVLNTYNHFLWEVIGNVHENNELLKK